MIAKGGRWSSLSPPNLDSLHRGCCVDDPQLAAEDVIRYIKRLPADSRRGFGFLLSWLNGYSLRHLRRPFHRLSVAQVRLLINQGEAVSCGGRKLPLITWDDSYAEHAAISLLAMLVRLVTNSRNINRLTIGMAWSPECRDPANLVHHAAPPQPCLTEYYDVCVVGSGAGGSLFAARAAAAGKRVLMIEAGNWQSPDSLIERTVNESGEEELLPARSDRVMLELYKNAGVQVCRRRDCAQNVADRFPAAESPAEYQAKPEN